MRFKIIILIFATLKHTVNAIFEPTVTIADIMRLIKRLKFKRFLTKIPRIVEKILIIIKIMNVFKNSKFTRFRLSNIDMFMTDEMTDIKK